MMKDILPKEYLIERCWMNKKDEKSVENRDYYIYHMFL